MAGGRAPKDKGNRYERACVNRAKEYGLKAERAWGSDGRSLGLHKEVDLVVEGTRIQAKSRKKLASYLLPDDNVDAVLIKEDFGEKLIILRYDEWLRLMALERNINDTPEAPSEEEEADCQRAS
jgi:hypothetical protein